MADPTPVRFPALGLLPFAVGIVAFAAAMFQFTADSNVTIAGNDAVYYGLAVEGGSAHQIVIGHHPLFHLLAWAAHTLIHALFGDLPLSGVWAVRAVSALGGAVGAAVLFHYAARAAGPAFALAITVAAAVTVGGRLFSAMGETYLPSYAGLLWITLSTFDRTARGKPLSLPWLIGITAITLALRQEAVLATAFLVGVLGTERAVANRRGRRAMTYLFGAGAATLALYLACYVIYRSDAPAPYDFVAWLTSLTSHEEWGRWGGIEDRWHAVRLALTMTAASWDHASLWSAHGSAALASAPMLGIAAPPAWLVWTLLLAPFGLAITVGVRGVCTRIAVWCVAGLFVPRLLFMAWWQPTNPEFHFANWIPVVALVLAGARGVPSRGRRIAIGVLAAAFALQAVHVGWRNQTLLFRGLAGRELAERVERVKAWSTDGTPVFAVDRFMHYALNRFGAPSSIVLGHQTYYGDVGPEQTTLELAAIRSAIRESPTGVIAVADTVLPAAFGRDQWFRPDQGPTWGMSHLLAIATGLPSRPDPFAIESTPLAGTPPWAVRVTLPR